jgi:23S rRNA (cytidine1920-2'-O)/16S rRNA (cytidine1409-2'-O)-methyltransferase
VGARPRLDVELVRRGIASSREQAQELIQQGRVAVNGVTATKAASQVDTNTSIVISEAESGTQYASRGGHKLAGALEAFDVDVDGKRCLDAGASTGGFTDVLLRAGAAEVVAVDVGYGQLVWSLQQDPRVRILDRTNVRHLTPEMIDGVVDLVVADLSFISLTLVLPALTTVAPDGELLLMVKPQFEVGKERLGSGGVVRDPQLRQGAIEDVAIAAQGHGWAMKGVVASPLPGPAGNVEYFLWLIRGEWALDRDAIAAAVADGPQ